MRKIMLTVLILCLWPKAYAADKSPAVEKLENGFYMSHIPEPDAKVPGSGSLTWNTEYTYIVDSTAGICYMSRILYTMGGSTDLQVVPCKSLKKRPEWATIITWE